jgi:hypothetical protein
MRKRLDGEDVNTSEKGLLTAHWMKPDTPKITLEKIPRP